MIYTSYHLLLSFHIVTVFYRIVPFGHPIFQTSFLCLWWNIHKVCCFEVVLSTFTILYTLRLYTSPKLFHHPKSPNPLNNTSHSLLPPSLATSVFYFLSMNLPILGPSYKWNHNICLFCVWLISLSIVFPRFIKWILWTRKRIYIPFSGWIIFCCTSIPFSWWTFGFFSPFGYCE